MKKILIITTISGFLDKFEKENVKILQELGYEVHYAANTDEQIYLYDETELTEMGVFIHHIDITKSPYCFLENCKALTQITDIIRKEQISVIHCHTPVGGVLGRLAGRRCRKQGVKVIYTAHGFHFYKGAPIPGRWVYHTVEKWMAYFTDILIVINEEDYKNAKKFHIKKGGSLYRIPGVGLDMEQFQPLSDTERTQGRKQLGLQEDDFFLLSVGELNQNKNQHAVLIALDQIRKSGRSITNIRYGICGDGVYREKMNTWIRELHLEDVAVMYGYCNPIRTILGCADALIFPSRREGLGMAALEALAMGIPVIAADNRGTREYMQHGKNGYVCKWDDVDSYADQIERMRSIDHIQREEMKKYCRQSVERFEKQHTNVIMREIYSNL